MVSKVEIERLKSIRLPDGSQYRFAFVQYGGRGRYFLEIERVTKSHHSERINVPLEAIPAIGNKLDFALKKLEPMEHQRLDTERDRIHR